MEVHATQRLAETTEPITYNFVGLGDAVSGFQFLKKTQKRLLKREY